MKKNLFRSLRYISTTAALTLSVAAAGKSAQAADIPSDGQIAQIVLTIDKAEMAAAYLAKENAVFSNVKEFADGMSNDHSRSKSDVEKLAKANNLKLASSAASDDIKKKTDAQYTDLKRQDKASFDRVYMQDQVNDHQEVLKTLNTVLIPNAKNPALVVLLKQTKTVVEQHLEHAQKVLATSQK